MTIKSTDVPYDRKKFSDGWDHMKKCEAAAAAKAAEAKKQEGKKKT